MKVYTLHLHERPLTLVKFNQDGDFFLTCAKDGEVGLVRTENCELVGTYKEHGTEKSGAVFAVDITRDSQHVVIATAEGKLIFFKLDGSQVGVLTPGGILKYVEFNQKPGCQDKVVLCNDKFKSTSEGSVPNRIMVYKWQKDGNSGIFEKLLSIDSQLPMRASKVKWGPYDETLISIFEEGTVIFWDATTGKQLSLLAAHTSPCTSVNFDRDRCMMLTCSKDHTAKLWAIDEDEPELVKTYKTDRPLNDCAIYPNVGVGELDDPSTKYHVLLGGGQDAKDVTTTAGSSGKFEACLWHMIFEEEIATIKGHFSPINTLAWFPDGRGFVTGAEEGYVKVWHFDNDYFTKKPFE